MLGVIIMNVGLFADTAEPDDGLHETAESVISGTTNVLFPGVSHTLLEVLLGIGLTLTWHSAKRRGHSPGWLLLRRYVALFLVFGLAHHAVFDDDILTHYSIAALLLIPVISWVVSGPRWRLLALAVALLPFTVALDALMEHLSSPPFKLDQIPKTLLAFVVGMWLARVPGVAEDDPETGGTRTARGRALRLAGLGLVAIPAGSLGIPGIALLTDGSSGPDDVTPLMSGALSLVQLAAGVGLLIGHALVYFGVIWWLVGRGRSAARLLGVFAPIGQMSLSVYLGSTTIFLLTLGRFPGEVPMLTQFTIGFGYALAVAALCPLWLRAFRYGPAEWLWRCLTYLRPLPLLRR